MRDRDKESFTRQLLILRAMYPNDYGLNEFFPLAYWECLRGYDLEAVGWAMSHSVKQTEHHRRMASAPELAGYARMRTAQIESRSRIQNCPQLSAGQPARDSQSGSDNIRQRNARVVEQVIEDARREGRDPVAAIRAHVSKMLDMVTGPK